MATELIVIDKANELEFFAEDGSEKALQLVKNHLADFVPDTTTDKGRKLIASNASKVGKSRKVLDDMGKRIRKNTLDSEKKRKIIFDEYQKEVRTPLDEWEVKKAEDDRIEAERVAAIQVLLDELKQMSCVIDGVGGELLGMTSLEFQWQSLDETDIDEETYQEFKSQAEEIKATNLEIIEGAMARRKTIDDDQAELARLREKEESEKAEDKHESQMSSDGVEMELSNVVDEIDGGFLHDGMSDDVAVNSPSSVSEQLEPVRQDAPIKRTSVPSSGVSLDQFVEGTKRFAALNSGKTSSNDTQKAEREHRRAINKAILKAIIACGFTEEQGKNFVAAMVAGDIPHVTVDY